MEQRYGRRRECAVDLEELVGFLLCSVNHKAESMKLGLASILVRQKHSAWREIHGR